MPDRPGTDMSHEHEWRHGAEWEKQARDPDYGPITEESNMTGRVDRETVEEIARENEQQGDVRQYAYEAVFETSPLGEKTAKTLRTLLAERDALEAENKRLRDALAVCSDPTRRDAHSVARATLAEQEKTDDQ